MDGLNIACFQTSKCVNSHNVFLGLSSLKELRVRSSTWFPIKSISVSVVTAKEPRLENFIFSLFLVRFDLTLYFLPIVAPLLE